MRAEARAALGQAQLAADVAAVEGDGRPGDVQGRRDLVARDAEAHEVGHSASLRVSARCVPLAPAMRCANGPTISRRLTRTAHRLLAVRLGRDQHDDAALDRGLLHARADAPEHL